MILAPGKILGGGTSMAAPKSWRCMDCFPKDLLLLEPSNNLCTECGKEGTEFTASR